MGKKHIVLTAVITAIATSATVIPATALITYYARDFIAAGSDNPDMKVSAVADMINKYGLFDVDTDKMRDYALIGMSAAVDDPYTAYYPKDEFQSYRENITTSYVGIGATIGADVEHNCLVIISPMEDSPAEKAGVKSGDILVAVDGTAYFSNGVSDAANYLKRGEEGTTAVLTLEREGKGRFELTVERQKIVKITVKSKMLADGVGYLRITGFEASLDKASKDTYQDFCEHLDALKTAGMSSLIIDIRDNPGGDLNIVCEIADKLLPEGMITYTEDKYGNKRELKSDNEELGMPMAILVNGGSASASEILTGALKDNGKATVIGTKTFGKGIVQTVFPFSDGSGMSLTTAKYYTPSGVCIHGIGIEPDIAIEMNTDKAISELSESEDIQLQKAMEVLKK